jgi:hypothetical protein
MPLNSKPQETNMERIAKWIDRIIGLLSLIG